MTRVSKGLAEGRIDDMQEMTAARLYTKSSRRHERFCFHSGGPISNVELRIWIRQERPQVA